MRLEIRREAEEDFRAVEEVTREAFWNLHVPGCDEHYLVHSLREHKDFLPELDFVAVHGAEIVGSILYSRSRVEDVMTITFGPVSVLPVTVPALSAVSPLSVTLTTSSADCP